MKVLFATSNPAKVRNYKEELLKRGIELLTLKDIDIHIPVEENGKNAIENAYIKAKAYYDKLGIPTIGMDNNLFIEDIPDELQPGVFVRRVNGKELNDDEMIEYYTELATNFGGKLKARWVYGIVMISDNDIHEYSWSYDDFYLVNKVNKKRNLGYPLDSISIDEKLNKYFVDFTEEDRKENEKRSQDNDVINFIIHSLEEDKDPHFNP